ncbi:hypothetical protein PoB_007237600 [Plakobranchus ocellatus]|uniref:Uncharacterized protein n=1 Tax=Plakobranchus ocellatus TaxID=259542 RepID=A0AAV4DPV2_9GAST|nr:hypothetical protein PoB_007237600 [Plakobranchus ocellatus]
MKRSNKNSRAVAKPADTEPAKTTDVGLHDTGNGNQSSCQTLFTFNSNAMQLPLIDGFQTNKKQEGEASNRTENAYNSSASSNRTDDKKNNDIWISNEKENDTGISSKMNVTEREENDIWVCDNKKNNTGISSNKKNNALISNKKDNYTWIPQTNNSDMSMSTNKDTDTSISTNKNNGTLISNSKSSDYRISNNKRKNETCISIKDKKNNTLISNNKKSNDTLISNNKITETLIFNNKITGTLISNKKSSDTLISNHKKSNGTLISNNKITDTLIPNNKKSNDTLISNNKITDTLISNNKKSNDTLICNKKSSDKASEANNAAGLPRFAAAENRNFSFTNNASQSSQSKSTSSSYRNGSISSSETSIKRSSLISCERHSDLIDPFKPLWPELSPQSSTVNLAGLSYDFQAAGNDFFFVQTNSNDKRTLFQRSGPPRKSAIFDAIREFVERSPHIYDTTRSHQMAERWSDRRRKSIGGNPTDGLSLKKKPEKNSTDFQEKRKPSPTHESPVETSEACLLKNPSSRNGRPLLSNSPPEVKTSTDKDSKREVKDCSTLDIAGIKVKICAGKGNGDVDVLGKASISDTANLVALDPSKTTSQEVIREYQKFDSNLHKKNLLSSTKETSHDFGLDVNTASRHAHKEDTHSAFQTARICTLRRSPAYIKWPSAPRPADGVGTSGLTPQASHRPVGAGRPTTRQAAPKVATVCGIAQDQEFILWAVREGTLHPWWAYQTHGSVRVDQHCKGAPRFYPWAPFNPDLIADVRCQVLKSALGPPLPHLNPRALGPIMPEPHLSVSEHDSFHKRSGQGQGKKLRKKRRSAGMGRELSVAPEFQKKSSKAQTKNVLGQSRKAKARGESL